MGKLPRTFVLMFQCKDQRGIVARISKVIYDCGGNIIAADQHTTGAEGGHFFMRVEFLMPAGFSRTLEGKLSPVTKKFRASCRLYDLSERPRMGILVSKADHCLREILYLWGIGELRADIAFVASNYQKHLQLVSQYDIPFHYVSANKKNRRELEILAVAKGADFLVLARYMLVLSGKFLKGFGGDIINIHHGFLPSFKGADPYGRAFHAGVKVIGATAHFVNDLLDDGPIITQEVESISHKDGLNELIKKGRYLERKALASAVASYIDHRVIRHANKTIVF